MDIKPIKTDADYRAALKEVESLMMAGPDTPEGEELDVMATKIQVNATRCTLILSRTKDCDIQKPASWSHRYFCQLLAITTRTKWLFRGLQQRVGSGDL